MGDIYVVQAPKDPFDLAIVDGVSSPHMKEVVMEVVGLSVGPLPFALVEEKTLAVTTAAAAIAS